MSTGLLYLSEKIAVAAYGSSFLFALTAMFAMIPRAAVRWLTAAAAAFLFAAMGFSLYACSIYGWRS